MPDAAGGRAAGGGREQACSAADRAPLGTRATHTASPGIAFARTDTATNERASLAVRLMNGLSAADDLSAFSTLIWPTTRLVAMLVPSVCVSSVVCAAARAPDLVCATSVSSTDLSLHRSALNHLRVAGGMG